MVDRERHLAVQVDEDDDEPDVLRISVAADGPRLDRFVLDAVSKARPELAPSRALIQRWIEEGRVRTGWRPLRKSSEVRKGEVLEIDIPPPAPPLGPLEAESIAVPILYQDEEILVLDKPAGLVVHPGAGQRTGTLANALLAISAGALSTLGGPERPGIVHRLDKDTSGVIVCARTDRAHRFLASAFHDRTVEKHYVAIVEGAPSESSGTIDAPIGRSPRDRKKMAVVEGGRAAVTHFTVRERFGKRAALLDVTIETGRTHQIRVHLASRGLPVLGDTTYGKASNLVHRQALHALKMSLPHPRGERLTFEAPLPADMQEALGALRKD